MDFSGWLRTRRVAHGSSQQALADACREVDQHCFIYQSRVTSWENGKELPSYRQFVILCLVMKLSKRAIRAGKRLWEQAQTSGLPDQHASTGPVALEDAPTAT